MKFLSILDLIITTQDAHVLHKELDVLIDSLYKTKEGFELTLNRSISIKIAQALQKTLLEEKVSIADTTNLKNLLEEMQQVIISLPMLQLTIAFSPSAGVVSNIYAWIQKNMDKKVLVELSIDPQVLGGAIISYEGQYKDLSLKKELDTVFETKKEEILAQIS